MVQAIGHLVAVSLVLNGKSDMAIYGSQLLGREEIHVEERGMFDPGSYYNAMSIR